MIGSIQVKVHLENNEAVVRGMTCVYVLRYPRSLRFGYSNLRERHEGCQEVEEVSVSVAFFIV